MSHDSQNVICFDIWQLEIQKNVFKTVMSSPLPDFLAFAQPRYTGLKLCVHVVSIQPYTVHSIFF